MIDDFAFPNVRQCLTDLIDGTEHLGQTVHAVWHQQADSYGALLGPFPEVLISSALGNDGDYDRVDRVVLECFAPGTVAVEILESVRASIAGVGIETESGYLDAIKTERVPKEVDYTSDTLNKAVAEFLVTSRPI